MYSLHDEGQGLVKVFWKDIRERVAKVNPEFARRVDYLSPDEKFPLYLAYYPYGSVIADTETPFLPQSDGSSYRLTDPRASVEIVRDLGYGKNDLPFSMLLDKKIEYYTEFSEKNISVPWAICSAGSIFPMGRILSKQCDRVYTPNGLLNMQAGIHSAFMVPNIGCATQHKKLQRDFNIYLQAPKSLYEQSAVFSELVNSPLVKCPWRLCLLYFSENWLTSLYTDPAWKDFKLYLQEYAWFETEYQRNREFYDMTFSCIQRNRNMKPNPYLADMAQHLFMMAMGGVPGYVPADNNEGLPVDLLQKIYVESYGLKKNLPTIIQAYSFSFEKDSFPIYDCFQYPTVHRFSPNSRKITNTKYESHELEYINNIYIQELSKEGALCADTILGEIAREIKFRYFHNQADQHKIISASSEMPNFDTRFLSENHFYKHEDASFAEDGPFSRGCISISRKKK